MIYTSVDFFTNPKLTCHQHHHSRSAYLETAAMAALDIEAAAYGCNASDMGTATMPAMHRHWECCKGCNALFFENRERDGL